MKELSILVQSRLRRLWRSKVALLIALLGPVVVLLLAGYAFSGSYGLRVGAFPNQQSPLGTQMTASLQQNGIDVQMFTSEDECVDAVRSGDRHVCLLFSVPFGPGENSTLTLVLDGSNLALTGILSDGLYGSIQQESFAVSTSLASKMAGAIEAIRGKARDGKLSIVKLTTTQDSALKLIQGGSQAVTALDVTIAGPDAAMASLNATNAAMGNVSLVPINETRKAIAMTYTGLANLSARINATLNETNTTTETRQVLLNISAQIATISTSLQGVTDKVGGLNASLQGSTAAVSSSLVALVDQLALTRQKIEAVATTRVGLSTNLQSASSALNEALIQVASLQQAMDSIEATVSGIAVMDPAKIGRPVNLVVRPLAGASRLASVFPALLVLVIAFGALILAPRLVHLERESGAEMRLSLILSSGDIRAVATVCTGIIMVAAQTLVLVLVSLAFFSGIITAPISTFFVALIVGSLFMLLGCALAYLLESEEAALLAALSLGILLFLFSGSVIPVERNALTSYNPLLIATDMVRQTSLFGVSFFDSTSALWLMLELFLALLACYGALALSQRSIMDNLLRKKK